jgi:hypothetical protein
MVVIKVWRSMCGCALVIRTPAASASRRKRRVAAWRSIRGTAAVAQNRPGGAGAYRPVDGPPDCWGQRDQDDFGAFAAHAQYPVAMLFTQIGNIGPDGLEEPQAKQPEHRHEREVARDRTRSSSCSAISSGRRGCAPPRAGAVIQIGAAP